jgi:hypothetical protein
MLNFRSVAAFTRRVQTNNPREHLCLRSLIAGPRSAEQLIAVRSSFSTGSEFVATFDVPTLCALEFEDRFP